MVSSGLIVAESGSTADQNVRYWAAGRVERGPGQPAQTRRSRAGAVQAGNSADASRTFESGTGSGCTSEGELEASVGTLSWPSDSIRFEAQGSIGVRDQHSELGVRRFRQQITSVANNHSMMVVDPGTKLRLLRRV